MFYKSIIFLILLIASNAIYGQYIESRESYEQNPDYLFFWKYNSDDLLQHCLLIPDSLSHEASIDIPVFFDLSTENFNDYKIDSSFIRFDDRAAQILCYLTKNSRNSSLVLSVLENYKDFFHNIISQYKLPESLAILPFALSSMNTNAKTMNGGKGIWQLKYAEAKLFGLQVDSVVDERLSVEKSTYVAIQRLKSLYNIYGDWQLSIKAYICGASNLNNYLKDSIHNSLPQNCSDIVSAFAASKVLYDNASDFGIDKLIEINDILYDTVRVSQHLHFKQISEVLAISLDSLRQLNPEFIKDYIPANKKQYIVRLPANMKSKFYLLEDSLYNYKKDIFLFNNKIETPPSPKTVIVDKAAIPKNSKLVYYTIKPGDNLGFISEWFKVSQRQLKGWNGISNPRKIRAGKKLKIYVPKGKYSYYKSINNMSFEEKQALSTKKTTNKTKTQKKSESLDSNYFIYTVRRGDSPYLIAKKYPGVSADDIMRWNNITNPSNIRPGEKLKIKKINR